MIRSLSAFFALDKTVVARPRVVALLSLLLFLWAGHVRGQEWSDPEMVSLPGVEEDTAEVPPMDADLPEATVQTYDFNVVDEPLQSETVDGEKLPEEPGEESESIPTEEPPPAISPLQDFAVDSAAAALDRTALGFGSGPAGFSGFLQEVPANLYGPIDFEGALSGGVIAGKETGEARKGEGEWKPGTRFSGLLGGVIGYPTTGRYLRVMYAGSIQTGGDEEEGTKYDQALSLEGYYGFARLKLRTDATFAYSNSLNRDVGRPVDQTLFGLGLEASYPLSLKTSLGLLLDGESSRYGTGINSTQFSGSIFVDRWISVKTSVGVELTGGTLQVDEQDSQVFEQINLRLSYVPTAKCTLSGSFGYEWRQIGNTRSGTPVFAGALSYAIRPTTTIALSASRSVANSASTSDTNYTSSTIRGSVSQKLGLKATASLSLGYQNAIYDSVDDPRSISREDNLVFIRPSLAYRITSFLSISLYYSYGENYSDDRPFTTQEGGINATYKF